MSHHSAPLASVACLLAASIAAQAPQSLANPTVPALPAHGGSFLAGRLPLGDRPEPVPDARWAPARLEFAHPLPQEEPQGQDYTPWGMFREAHGAFMNEYRRFRPDVSVGFGLYPDQGVRHEPGSFDLIQAGFDASFPVAVSDSVFFKFGAYTHVRDYKFSTPTRLDDESVYAIGFEVGGGMFLDPDLLIEFEARPGIYSDCDGTLHHNDFDMPASILATWRAGEGLYWKGGFRYNQVYQDAPWLPYLGVSWNITSTMLPPGEGYESGTWRVDVLLPEYAELSYAPSADMAFQLGVDITGAQYHVRSSAARGRQRGNIQVQEVTTYLGATYRFSDALSVQGKIGAVVAGDYDLTNGTAGFDHVEGALSEGLFATFTLGFSW